MTRPLATFWGSDASSPVRGVQNGSMMDAGARYLRDLKQRPRKSDPPAPPVALDLSPRPHPRRVITTPRSTVTYAGKAPEQVQSVPSQQPAGIFIPAPSQGQVTLALVVAAVVGWMVDNPVRRAVRRYLGIGGENKTMGSWDSLSREELIGDSSDHSDEYRMALARTRQAVAVQRAAEWNRSRQTGRAVAELQRALGEHNVCRSAILPGSVEDVEGLYTMALQNISAQIPPEYGVLLELRSLLGISKDKAEELEELTVGQPDNFSI